MLNLNNALENLDLAAEDNTLAAGTHNLTTGGNTAGQVVNTTQLKGNLTMTNLIPNTRSTQKVTLETIQENIGKANFAHVQSKDAAAEAAARAYLVWIDTLSPIAHKDAKDWLNAEIATRNETIDRHNKELKALRSQENGTGLALTAQEWAARRKVKIEAREGANPFTEIVKFVFNFDAPAQASLVSRYANVLAWINAKFGHSAIEDITQITDAIKAAGGFEDVLTTQRGNDIGGDNNGIDTTDQVAIDQAIAAKTQAAILEATAKATFALNVSGASDGIVLVLGRYVGGTVEVISDKPVAADGIPAVLSQFNDQSILQPNATPDFIARVLSLGELVDEGMQGDVTEDEIKAGKLEKVRRSLTLMPNKANSTDLLVSTRYANSSTIIKATPAAHINIGSVDVPMMLSLDDRRSLEKLLASHTQRCLIDVIPQLGDDTMTWVFENSALVSIDSANATQRFSVESLIDEPHKPLDIDAFRADFTVDMTTSDLSNWYQTCLKPWKGTKDNKRKPMKLTFRNSQMTCDLEGMDTFTLACSGSIRSAVALQFRPRDLHDLVLKLTTLDSATFKVSGDTGGLMRVTWSDALGQYAVYVPTVTKDFKLEHRRVAPLQIDVALSAAA